MFVECGGIKAEVQVFKREFHIHIHLDYVIVEFQSKKKEKKKKKIGKLMHPTN